MKLSVEQVRIIKAYNWPRDYGAARAFAAWFGVKAEAIMDIWRGRTWARSA